LRRELQSSGGSTLFPVRARKGQRPDSSQLVEGLKAAHPSLTRIFFDFGFHSPENARRIADLLPDACLPNSGEKALAAQAATASASWTWQRLHHSGIEAAIGLRQDNRDCRRCPDRGRDGYARFLQSAVLAGNLITLDRLCWAKDVPARLRQKSRKSLTERPDQRFHGRGLSGLHSPEKMSAWIASTRGPDVARREKMPRQPCWNRVRLRR